MKNHIKMHLKMAHEESLLPCLHCGCRCAENCSLNNLIKFVHASDEFVCFKCGDKYKKISWARKHVTTNHLDLASYCQEFDQSIQVTRNL